MVSDDEILYRSVPNHPDCFSTADGNVRFSSSAFNDRAQKVSVDRAQLVKSGEDTKFSETDGVVALLTEHVRAIDSVKQEENGPAYRIDVIARPVDADEEQGIKANPAHAQVESAPELANKSRFKKLKEALAQLATRAGWHLEPSRNN